MSVWIYTGQTPTGKKIEGEIDADTKEAAQTMLRKKRIVIIKLKKKPIELKLEFLESVSIRDLARFTRQFSAMNSAGLPLIQCLDILSEQTEKKKLKTAIQRVSGDIQGGATLADSLSKHPAIFSDLYCHMVSAGEAGGILDSVLMRLADYQEKTEKLVRKVKKAMLYPTFVFLFSIVVIAVLLIKVVPVFADLFVNSGNKMPVPTQIVLSISHFLQANYLYLLLAIVVPIFFLYRYYKTDNGKYQIDKLILKVPAAGNLARKSSVSRFTRTLSTLLSAGVPIIESLRITSKTAGNKVLEKGILKALESISGGQTIADPLKATGIFPPMVIQMITIGEKTGGLAEMLGKVSDFFDDEVDSAVDGITSLIEPFIIVFLGAFIGGILIALYLPMFDIAGNIN